MDKRETSVTNYDMPEEHSKMKGPSRERHESNQNFNVGDNQGNPTQPLPAYQRQQYFRNCQCKSHHSDAKSVEFTPAMIRQQESLVTTMTQQGIPESLIQRQFDRLLEEQTKQLQLSNVTEAPTTKTPKTRKVEPISLLKIRMQKENLQSRGRNNGLQDPTSVVLTREKSPCEDRSVKLNGIQEGPESTTPEDRYVVPPAVPRFSSNGLENSRNPNNPPIAPKSNRVQQIACRDQPSFYPARKSCHPPDEPKKIEPAVVEDQATPNSKVEPDTPQQFYYWPAIQEPRVIGGFTFLARKPEYNLQNRCYGNCEHAKS